jgi:hypothetical protein
MLARCYAGSVKAFVQSYKHLHLGIRTQPSGSQRYVVVRRPAGSSKLVCVTLTDAAPGAPARVRREREANAVKLAVNVNARMDRGINPNEEKKAKRAAEHAVKLAKVEHSFLAMGRAYIARCKRLSRRS